jgi:predicted phage tail protein
MVISTMTTRHNIADYEAVGLDWHHLPVASCAEATDALEELLPLLRRELRRAGAVAIHGNRHTDFVAAVCAAHLHEHKGVAPAAGLASAAAAGLTVTEEAAALLGVDPYWEAVQPRASIAASTSSGRSVIT